MLHINLNLNVIRNTAGDTRKRKGIEMKRGYEFLGKSHNKYSYWLNYTDLYVYQLDESSHKWLDWFCSYPAWQRTLHKILDN